MYILFHKCICTANMTYAYLFVIFQRKNYYTKVYITARK